MMVHEVIYLSLGLGKFRWVKIRLFFVEFTVFGF